MGLEKDDVTPKTTSLGSLASLLKGDERKKVKGTPKRTSSWSSLLSSFSGSSLDTEIEGLNPYERQLHKLRRSAGRKRVSLKEFVEGSKKEEICSLREIIEGDDCKWKILTFRDTIEGKNYKQWQSKRNTVYKHLMNVADEKDIMVQFEGMLEICFEEMSTNAIVKLLSAIRKDSTVRVLKFSGVLDYRYTSHIVEALEALLIHGDRPWNAVIFHAKFGAADPKEYPLWAQTMKTTNLRLGELAVESNVPIGVETCKN